MRVIRQCGLGKFGKSMIGFSGKDIINKGKAGHQASAHIAFCIWSAKENLDVGIGLFDSLGHGQ